MLIRRDPRDRLRSPSRVQVCSGILLLLLLSLSTSESWSQDSHYWTEQYGTRANLLGGVVIGSVDDVSATYYNPGALGLFGETSILVATRVYQYVSLNYPDAAGPGVDLSSSRFTVAPDFISGEIPITWLGSNRIAYSILTRQNQEFDLRAQIDDPNPDGSAPTEDLSAGSIRLQQRFSEYWFGLTWAKPLHSRVGFGITGYGAARGQQWRFDGSVNRAIANPPGTETVAVTQDARFWNVRLLAKLGLALDFEPLTLGVNLTTPSASLMGDGEVFYSESSTGIDGSPPPYDQAYLAQNYQNELAAEYQSSWAAGLGGAYDFGPVKLHVSAEWFDAVTSYTVIEAESFYPQSGGEAVDTDLRHSLRSIWNWGLGVEFPLSERMRGYTSYTSDASAANRSNQEDLAVSEWNVHQITGGVEVALGGTNALTCGLGYGWGSRPVQLGLESSSEDDILSGEMDVSYMRLKVLLGLSIAF